MGWNGGTTIFDVVCADILSVNEKSKKEMITNLIDELEDHDWDNQVESDYFDHELVQEIFRERNPEWFEDENY